MRRRRQTNADAIGEGVVKAENRRNARGCMWVVLIIVILTVLIVAF